VSALTCNGNSLHPGKSGREHDRVVRKTIELAPKLGVDRVVLMSGCPGAKGDKHPNWITVAWPPETTGILEWQWNRVLIPYWRKLVAFAARKGIRHLCLELHGGQNVYNVSTLRRLRDACGEAVGVNFDPSHLMWMGADPLAAVEALGEAIFHVHAKDTRIEPVNAAIDSRIETRPGVRVAERSWNYVTLGYGHGEDFWRAFCLALRRVGYDGVLSIEHEDMALSPMEGMRKSVELLRRVVIVEPAAYELPKI
jgi:sugar phosphate isomerase/epimerase